MNKKLIIRIEEKLLFIIRADETKEDLHINECRTFEFPDHLKRDLRSRPGELADFIASCLKGHEYDLSGITLLFDSKLGFFSEYKFKKTDNKMADKRFYVEDDNQKNNRSDINITYRSDYPVTETDDDMSRAAIYGIEDRYFRELIRILNKNNIHIEFAGSSMITYKDSMVKAYDLIASSREAKRFIGIDICANTYRAVVAEESKPIHLEESFVPDDAKPEDKNLIDLLTDLIRDFSIGKENTLVVVSGNDSESEAKRLMSYSGITCKPVLEFYDDEVMRETFCITGLDPKKNKNDNYLYGGWGKRKFSRATTKICVAAAVVIVLLFSMLPIYSLYMGGTNNDLNSEIENISNPKQLELIWENRDVFAELQAYKDDLAAIDADMQSYSEVLTLLNKDLLDNAVINDLFYDEKSGLIIDFDVTDVSGYENARDKLNDERQVLVVETATGAAISESGKQNVQIKVTIPGSKEDRR